MISLKFNLQRVKDIYSNPVILNRVNNSEVTCLVDTGARVPVWCSGEKTLLACYPDCTKQNAIFILSGFGKGYEIASVYMIPNFILSDGRSKLVYKNLLVAVIAKDFSVDMILSYTMFNKMNISVDTFSNRNGFHITEPNFKISAHKSEYYVRYKLINSQLHNRNALLTNFGTCNIIDSIYIFTQH